MPRVRPQRVLERASALSAQERIRIQFPRIGDRVRFAIWHADTWRPLGWVRVAKDGSVYLGLLLGRPSVAKFVSGPSGKEVHVSEKDFKDVPIPKSSRISFKASGEIHILGDKVVYGKPLASLAQPRQVCLMRFAHPSRYQSALKKNPNDYDMNVAGYAIVEHKPMYGALILAPFARDCTLPAKLPSMEAAATFALGYRGLTSGLDLIVQVILGHGPAGTWPGLPGVFLTARTTRR